MTVGPGLQCPSVALQQHALTIPPLAEPAAEPAKTFVSQYLRGGLAAQRGGGRVGRAPGQREGERPVHVGLFTFGWAEIRGCGAAPRGGRAVWIPALGRGSFERMQRPGEKNNSKRTRPA